MNEDIIRALRRISMIAHHHADHNIPLAHMVIAFNAIVAEASEAIVKERGQHDD